MLRLVGTYLELPAIGTPRRGVVSSASRLDPGITAPVGSSQYRAASGPTQEPRSRFPPRLCLLKGCEQTFCPHRHQERYCSADLPSASGAVASVGAVAERIGPARRARSVAASSHSVIGNAQGSARSQGSRGSCCCGGGDCGGGDCSGGDCSGGDCGSSGCSGGCAAWSRSGRARASAQPRIRKISVARRASVLAVTSCSRSNQVCRSSVSARASAVRLCVACSTVRRTGSGGVDDSDHDAVRGSRHVRPPCRNVFVDWQTTPVGLFFPGPKNGGGSGWS